MESISFSTGQIFIYWSRWEQESMGQAMNLLAWGGDNGYNTTELFNGYSESELFVKEVHKTMREEVIQSGFVSIKEWWLHFKKALQYLGTEKVKKMRGNAEYGIRADRASQPISSSHILSIILYCDTNELQNNFSCSFRKKNTFETLQSLKKRHQKYYHFAKNIVEAIHVYGINGHKRHEHDEHEKGPFYCGLSVVLNIGSFAIYLKGPTSTTKDISVAINFAKRKGQIMELQNDTYRGQIQNMFDCSWISNYSEENERLWIGYQHMWRLRIESIRIIENNQNHKDFFNALHVFDSILSGENMRDMKVTKKNIKVISSLIEMKLGEKSDENVNKYILNCFNLYLLKKSNIIISPLYVCMHQIPFLFYALPIFEMDRKKRGDVNKFYVEFNDGLSGSNLLNIKLLETLFPNINHITINDFDYFQFDLWSLLALIQDSKRNIEYRIIAERGRSGGWLFNRLSSKVVSGYKDKKVDIKYEKDGANDTIYIHRQCV